MDRSHAERVLDLPKLLERVAERCETEFGAEVVRDLQPSFDREVIAYRLRTTGEAVDLILRGDMPVYANARDVREPVRNAAKGSVLPGDSLFRIAETLGAFSRLGKYLQINRELAPTLWQLAESLPFLGDLQTKIESSVSPEGDVLDSASPELKAARAKKAAQTKRILDRVQSMVNSLRSYLQEPLFTERSGRYVLPVKSAYKGKVPGIVHDSSGSGQTLYIEPQSVVEETNKLREIEGIEKEEVEKVLRSLSEEVGKNGEAIAAGLVVLGEIDGALACGKDAEKTNGHLPKLIDEPMLRIEKGHHPLLDRNISVPLDLTVGGNAKSLLVTGPNTGGKTVCLKTLGLYSLMIGCGILPPAKRTEYGPFSGIWSDIGDEQSIEQSLSTFSGHLKNVSRALNQARAGALCLFDEIGAGTDPAEGAAIGKAVLDTLSQRGVVIAATTHYGELKEFAIADDRFTTAAMEFDLETLRPTYRLIPGATGASHAFEIARRYGLPDEVAVKAESLLGESAVAERQKSARLDDLVSSAARERDEAEEIRKAANAELGKLREERENLKRKLTDTREATRDALAEALREMRAKYRELLDATTHLKGAQREEVLEKARELESEFAGAAKMLDDVPREVDEIAVGDTVRVRGRAQLAQVLELQRGGTVVLQVGGLRFTVKREDVEQATPPKEKTIKRRQSSTVNAAANISSELMLRRMRVDEAQGALESYLDDATLAGLHKARIVHGKGDGVLRKFVRDFLARRQEVSRYYEAGVDAGGAGVTIVEFK
ncbi:MAG: endonuclease MutS2 [Fimbriimonadales bacterium]